MSDTAFGHGGFTGTAMWIDPELDLYVIFLGDRLHPDGVGEVNDLAGRIGTMACAAIKKLSASQTNALRRSHVLCTGLATPHNSVARSGDRPRNSQNGRTCGLGIDVLVADGFKQLDGKRVGLDHQSDGCRFRRRDHDRAAA